MRLKARHRRRNKRARAVRRLQGVVNAQDMKIKSLVTKVESLGGEVDSLDREFGRAVKAKRQGEDKWKAEVERLCGRITKLERVPRVIRWLFRAG